MSEPETCASCRFYRPSPNFVPAAGHCHRRAPGRDYLDCAAWPSVPPGEWCGEWEKRPPAGGGALPDPSEGESCTGG